MDSVIKAYRDFSYMLIKEGITDEIIAMQKLVKLDPFITNSLFFNQMFPIIFKTCLCEHEIAKTQDAIKPILSCDEIGVQRLSKKDN